MLSKKNYSRCALKKGIGALLKGGVGVYKKLKNCSKNNLTLKNHGRLRSKPNTEYKTIKWKIYTAQFSKS